MTRRISLVAVSRSRLSPSACLRLSTSVFGCGYGGVVGRRGLPPSPRNFIVGAFSCWQAGHGMPAPPLLERGQGSRQLPTLGGPSTCPHIGTWTDGPDAILGRQSRSVRASRDLLE